MPSGWFGFFFFYSSEDFVGWVVVWGFSSVGHHIFPKLFYFPGAKVGGRSCSRWTWFLQQMQTKSLEAANTIMLIDTSECINNSEECLKLLVLLHLVLESVGNNKSSNTKTGPSCVTQWDTPQFDTDLWRVYWLPALPSGSLSIISQEKSEGMRRGYCCPI